MRVEENMSEVTIVEVKPVTVLGMRKTGSYKEIPAMMGSVYGYAMSAGIKLTGPAYYIAHELSEDEAKKADAAGTADLEVAFPVVGSGKGSGEFKVYDLPGGNMAKIVHKGPYEGMSPTYGKLFAWMAENHKKIAAPIREAYLNDPSTVKPEDLITEIYAPIE